MRIHALTAVAGLMIIGSAVGAANGAATIGEPLRPLLITVDDLPIAAGKVHPEPADRDRITRGLLAALAKHRIHALGMVTWNNVHGPADLQLLELWLAGGHELGNHSMSHLHYTATPAEAYREDIEKGRTTLAGFLAKHGKTVRFFRFPFLEEGNTAEKLDAMRVYLESSGQKNLPVTIDDQDWSFEEPWAAARKAADPHARDDVATPRTYPQVGGVATTRDERARVRDEVAADYLAALRVEVRHHEETGDALFGRRVPQILLLHAGEVGSANWDALFTWLERTGHRFATADEVLSDPAFSEPHRYVGPYGFGLWDRIADGRRARKAREQIESLLKRQSEAWSCGDVEGFCSVYAEDALFLSPSGLTRGREAVLDRYRKKYPGKEAMGTLSLEILEVGPVSGTEFTLLGDAVPGRIHGASVSARWTLTYPDKTALTGLTLLVLHREGKDWLIVQDASM